MVATATASGKTLCYNVPVLEALAHGTRLARASTSSPPRRWPRTSCAPCVSLPPPDLQLRATSPPTTATRRRRERAGMRQSGRDRPDQPGHAARGHPAQPLAVVALPAPACSYVVMDEAHVYRGVFGSHVA